MNRAISNQACTVQCQTTAEGGSGDRAASMSNEAILVASTVQIAAALPRW